MSSEEGVQQGDPLGPAFFALTILTTSRELNNLQLLKWNVWYLDDGILVGPKETLLEVLQLLKLSFSNIGLAVNMLKCKLWRPDDYSEAPPALPITWSKWNEDIRVLGVPFGSSTSYLHNLQSMLQSVWKMLPHLSDAQVSFTLFRV